MTQTRSECRFTDMHYMLRDGQHCPRCDYIAGGYRSPLPFTTTTEELLPLREEDLRQLAAQMLDVKFGVGRDYAHKAIRNDLVTKRIHECAIELIADLLRVGSASG